MTGGTITNSILQQTPLSWAQCSCSAAPRIASWSHPTQRVHPRTKVWDPEKRSPKNWQPACSDSLQHSKYFQVLLLFFKHHTVKENVLEFRQPSLQYERLGRCSSDRNSQRHDMIPKSTYHEESLNTIEIASQIITPQEGPSLFWSVFCIWSLKTMFGEPRPTHPEIHCYHQLIALVVWGSKSSGLWQIYIPTKTKHNTSNSKLRHVHSYDSVSWQCRVRII